MTNLLSVTEMSTRFGVSTRTLRFYETKGLLHPTRNGWSRVYSEEDQSRLCLILKGKSLGFSLCEIASLLNQHSVDESPNKSFFDLLDRRTTLTQIENLTEERQRVIAAIDELKAL